ncbi:MAG: hypothetical protein J1E34_02610 [Oscillospiraceae bacterium]|nr:hypothetical protein [Oscillospiraceae bacterium]
MREDRIISALIGLIGACNNNPKTKETDNLVIKALAASSDTRNADAITYEILAEKKRISPGCAVCQMPCGNTSDYDMNRIYTASDEIKTLKLQILCEIRETAEFIYKNDVPLSEEKTEFFYKALSYLSCDIEKEPLNALLNEAQELKQKIKETL